MKYIIFFIVMLQSQLVYAINSCTESLFIGYDFSSSLSRDESIYPLHLKDLEDKNIENIDIDSDQNLIQQLGIEDYIKQSLTGSISSNFSMFGQKISLLDIALANDAKWDTVKYIVHKGITPSYTGWMIASMTLDDEKLLELATFFPSEIIGFDQNEPYSFNNLLIKYHRFNVIDKLNKMGAINNELFYKGKLIDLDAFSILEKAKISDYINLEKYIEKAKLLEKREEEIEYTKRDFISKFSHHRLVEICIANEKSAPLLDSAFVVNKDKFIDFIKEAGITLTSPLEAALRVIDKPRYQEYFSHLKTEQKFKNKRVVFLKPGENFEMDSKNNDLKKNNPDEIVIDAYGLTRLEYTYFTAPNQPDLNSPNFRLDVFAKNFERLYSTSLKDRMINDASFRKIKLHGKNFSFYAAIYVDDSDILRMIINNFGQPSSDYGYNFEEKLINIMCFSSRGSEDKKLLNSLKKSGVLFDFSKVRTDVRKESEKCNNFKAKIRE
ncbi:hypothetical protein HG263_06190 [Pseudoalteromonas sp. JBTF-M23]|uniref:Uncharacterized protein n=1 Tax=Pseudoalteromonas caenipelagi TaxID=2726988 RepID=A0A849V966_9GAMM|nr:hypothetical protein [Pseudoalteromonas caenipelagi]NOU50129.1 hypothetical protein [Pseudoalteromonas caenipelagi]